MLLTIQINNGNISTRNDTSLAHDKPQAPRASCNHHRAPFQCERSQCSLEMKTTPTLHRLAGGVLVFIWMFNDDCIVCTAESALVGIIAQLQRSRSDVRLPFVLLVEFRRTSDRTDGVDRLCERNGCCKAGGGCGESFVGATSDT